MRAIHTLFVLFFLGFTVSCSTTYGVKYDYDQQANFADLKTFDWMPVPEKSGTNSLVVQRVKNAVNAELKAKGLMMTSNNPDFLIAQHLGKKDKVQVTDWGYGYGLHGGYRGGYRGGYWGPGGVSTYKYEEGSLILDFVDAKSKKMIWRGAAKAEVQNADTPEKSEKVINEAVKEILKNFPPVPSK
jgi:hypothetical protein